METARNDNEESWISIPAGSQGLFDAEPAIAQRVIGPFKSEVERQCGSARLPVSRMTVVGCRRGASSRSPTAGRQAMDTFRLRSLVVAGIALSALACSEKTARVNPAFGPDDGWEEQIEAIASPLQLEAGQTCTNKSLCLYGDEAVVADAQGQCFVALTGARFRREVAQSFVATEEAAPGRVGMFLRQLAEPASPNVRLKVELRQLVGSGIPTESTEGSVVAAASLFLNPDAYTQPKDADYRAAINKLATSGDHYVEFKLSAPDSEGQPTPLIIGQNYAFVLTVEDGAYAVGVGCTAEDVYPQGRAHIRMARRSSVDEHGTPIFSTAPFVGDKRDVLFSFSYGDGATPSDVTVLEKYPPHYDFASTACMDPPVDGPRASSISKLRVRFSSNVDLNTVTPDKFTVTRESDGTSLALASATLRKGPQFGQDPLETGEVEIEFANQLDYDTAYIVRLVGGDSGILSALGRPLSPSLDWGSEDACDSEEEYVDGSSGATQDYVWRFVTRKQGDLDPWRGTVSAGAGWSYSTKLYDVASGIPVDSPACANPPESRPATCKPQYKLFTVTGESTPVGITSGTVDGTPMKIRAGFIATTQPTSGD